MDMLLRKGMRGKRPDDLFFTPPNAMELPRITTFTQELRGLLMPSSPFRDAYHKQLSMVMLDVTDLEDYEKIPDGDVLYYVQALSETLTGAGLLCIRCPAGIGGVGTAWHKALKEDGFIIDFLYVQAPNTWIQSKSFTTARRTRLTDTMQMWIIGRRTTRLTIFNKKVFCKSYSFKATHTTHTRTYVRTHTYTYTHTTHSCRPRISPATFDVQPPPGYRALPGLLEAHQEDRKHRGGRQHHLRNMATPGEQPGRVC